MMIIDLSSK